MCFSAEASFTSAAVLSAIGYFSCKSLKHKDLLLFAIVPFLFALQQFSEGMVWFSLKFNQSDPYLLEYSKSMYLIFAFLIWPIFFPFSIYYAEKDKIRKKILGFLSFAGLLLSIYFIFYALDNKISIYVINHSIQYQLHTPFTINIWLITGIYSAIVLIPCFVSSLELMWTYGLFLVFSWLVSEHFYYENFTSIWCFFSAIISSFIYLILRANESFGREEN